MSIFLILLKFLWFLMVFFIKPHVLIHLNKNGVVEHTNIHLGKKKLRTILIHGDILQRFWGDDVLNACYLINRMSSPILDNKIPHSILFPRDPLHILPFKVFESHALFIILVLVLINYAIVHLMTHFIWPQTVSRGLV